MERTFFKIALATVAVVSGIHSYAQETVNYTPNIHGTIRTRAEWATETGEYRFQVKNARISLDGKIAPNVDYFLNTDFCDQGKVKVYDAWARLGITKGLYVQAGQFRTPFGVDPLRSPQNFFFSNRSFLGKQVGCTWAVGAKVAYTLPKTPLTIEAGAFNPTAIADHDTWNKKLAYAGKASYKIQNVTLSTGVQSIIPDGIRANLIDGAINWTSGRWTVEGEYINEHYTNKAHKDCNAYVAFANYALPIKLGSFNRLSFQGRFDGMTDHSTGTRNAVGELVTNNPARNRVTAGTTLSYIRAQNLFVDIRLDYEKYFYHDGVVPTSGNGDKALVELIFRF